MNWVELISTVGFPIVACFVLALYVKYKDDKHRQTILTLQENHKSEMIEYKTEIKTAIDNNTKVIEKLIDRLER